MSTESRMYFIGVLMFFAFIANTGHAQVFVDSPPGTSMVSFNGTTQKYTVTLNATGPNLSFYVYAEPENGTLPAIANIDVATNGHPVSLFIGENAAGSILPPSSLDNLDYDPMSTGSVRLVRGLIEGDLGESGQSHVLRVSEVEGLLFIAGDAWAKIEVTPGLFNFTGINELVIGGNLYSGVRVAPDGFFFGTFGIDSIEVQGSVIGSLGSPVIVESDYWMADIRVLGNADHFVVRPVTCDSDTCASPKVDFITVFGSMTGEIALPNSQVKEIRIGRAGDVGGDFAGTIDIGYSTSVIEIGGTLATGSLIKFNEPTIAPIIVNNSDVGGEWLGDVEYIGVLLAKPQYVQTESELFGSRVGQVPFLIHGVDSSLTFGSSAPLAESFVDDVIVKPYTGGATVPADPESMIAQVRFFGAVQPKDGWSCGVFGCPGVHPAPFVFERRPVGGSLWRDISECYNATMFYVDPTTVVLAQSWYENPAGLEPVNYRNGYEYRLRPTEDLLCNLDRLDPNAPDVPVGDDAITWRVGNLCPADLNADGVVDAADLGILLNVFGDDDPNGDCAELLGDVTGDNIVNAADLGVLLNSFGNTECGPSAPGGMAMAMMGGGGGSVTSAELMTALGFENADAFASFVAELEPAKQIEAITAAWVLAKSLEENTAEQSE